MGLTKIDQVVERIGSLVSRVATVLTGLLIVFMVSLITVDVIGRTFGQSTLIATAASGYALVGVVFLGLAVAERAGLHVTVRLLTRRLAPRVQQYFEVICLILIIVFAVWLGWSLFQLTQMVYVNQTISTDRLRIALWIPYSVGPVGIGMYVLVMISKLYRTVRTLTGLTNDAI